MHGKICLSIKVELVIFKLPWLTMPPLLLKGRVAVLFDTVLPVMFAVPIFTIPPPAPPTPPLLLDVLPLTVLLLTDKLLVFALLLLMPPP